MLSRLRATMRIAFGDSFEAAPFHQAYRGVDNRLRREAVLGADLEAENVADKVKGADLAAAVREQLVAPHRAGHDLVDVVRRLLLAEDFGAFPVAEFIQIEFDGRALFRATLTENTGKFSGAGSDAGKHGPTPCSNGTCRLGGGLGIHKLNATAAVTFRENSVTTRGILSMDRLWSIVPKDR